MPNEVEDKVNQKFIHTYLKPGFYNIQVNISNQISYHVLTERVSIELLYLRLFCDHYTLHYHYFT